MQRVLQLLKKDENFKELCHLLAATSRKELHISAPSFFRPFLVAGLFTLLEKSIVVVTDSPAKADAWASEIGAFLPRDRIGHLLPWENLPFEVLSPSPETVARRLDVLHRASKRPLLVITDGTTLVKRMAPPTARLENPVQLEPGLERDPHDLADVLVKWGYQRTGTVEEKGRFSLRGGILDVYTPQLERPVRIEFFGDSIETMRFFEPTTQRSTQDVADLQIFRCRELELGSSLSASALKRIAAGRTPEVEQDIAAVEQGRYFEGAERFLPLVYEEAGTLLDYLPEEVALLWDDFTEVRLEAERTQADQQRNFDETPLAGKVLDSPRRYFVTLDEMRTKITRPQLYLSSIETPPHVDALHFKADPIESFLGKEGAIIAWLKKRDAKTRVIISLADEPALDALTRRLADHGLTAHHARIASRGISAVQTSGNDISEGFTYPAAGLALLGKGALSGPLREPARLSRGPATLQVDQLEPGDLVVHSDYGIGRYLGLIKEEVGSGAWECLVLRYQNGVLKTRTDQLDKVSRYIGENEEQAQISRLGGRQWQRAKTRAKKAAKKLALDLLGLYAERAQGRGYGFSADSPWQHELEDGFPYQETADQLRAIHEVKADMEGEQPMDRLVCGDVGYGKTEVALRAAFKAVMDGKQVLFLVPTTILAQQHWATFRNRMAPFPIQVEMLSRFRTPRGQRAVVADLTKGKVDVVIGTHRLLQSDVKLKDLGLVIIDEEQRFGVEAKERLRDLRRSVDVLTMTATPIPRTLQMALAGVRNLSVIDTAPENRQPIVTTVNQFDPDLIKKAINWELHRGGQIYYVHNRVEDIQQVASFLKQLVPEVRIAIAHGQMAEGPLEEIMLAFLDKRHDLLLCTTIIESGIDIPSVNTLIVDDAERLGLAQLYQLRGRVGRSDRRAYAYVLYNQPSHLSKNAADRLKTVAELTALGSGFKIALRDLEIRGAGNLLGPEQHGQLTAVGFHLYVDMLRQAIEELEGKPVIEPALVNIRLPIRAFIPSDYLPEESLRIEIYRRLSGAKGVTEIDAIRTELADRFGPPPSAVDNLFEIAAFRDRSRRLGITLVSWQNGKLSIFPVQKRAFDDASSKRVPPNFRFKSDRQTLLIDIADPRQTIQTLSQILASLEEATRQPRKTQTFSSG